METDANCFVTKWFQVFFYSNENNEPAADGKVWLEPNIIIAYMHGFTNADKNEIINIITANYELLKNKWYEFFN